MLVEQEAAGGPSGNNWTWLQSTVYSLQCRSSVEQDDQGLILMISSRECKGCWISMIQKIPTVLKLIKMLDQHGSFLYTLVL